MSSKVWSGILNHLILPAGDSLFGQHMMKRFHHLEEAQWWNRDRIYAERDKALVDLIRIAYKEVPFYRDLMNQNRIIPQDIKTPADLHKLPIVTKEMFRRHYPHNTVRHTGSKQFEVHTSGSTGTNFCVVEDRRTTGWHRASFLLSLTWAGWKIGEPHLQTGMTVQRSLDRKLKDIFMRCHYFSAQNLSNENLDRCLQELERHNLDHLWGYPAGLYLVASRALQKGFYRKLKSVITWGDGVYPHYREAMKKAFGVEINDTYGCGEGMQMAAQCGHSTGYHIHSLDVIIEAVDDNGQAVPPGSIGNLLITRLYPGPMPLIRYRIGDLGILGNSATCECGRGFDVLASLQGRETDAVITPDGKRLIGVFFAGVIQHFPEIESYQVIQEKLDSIVVRVVPRKEFTAESGKNIVRSLQEQGATGLRINVETVDEIKVGQTGKRRFIISNVSKSDHLLDVV